MVKIEEVIDPDLLQQEIDAGFVDVRTCPERGWNLHIYSKTAQYKNRWNQATINARGLVTDADGNVIARPFPKFFNYGDPTAGELDLDARVDVLDKLDGSLGIMLPDETFASKGSFQSHVAEHATARYAELYKGTWTPREDLTYLFEVIFPAGRIVLDYGDKDDLVLLGAVETETGRVVSPKDLPEWPGEIADTLKANTLREALALPLRENAEGVVIRFTSGRRQGDMVKLKQSDYTSLHAIVTNTSAITLWEAQAVNDVAAAGMERDRMVQSLRMDPDRIDRALRLGQDWENELSAGVPDEFHEWMRETITGHRTAFVNLLQWVREIARSADDQGFESRKDLVAWLKERDKVLPFHWGLVMTTLTHGDDMQWPPARVRAELWKLVRPKGGDSIGWGQAT